MSHQGMALAEADPASTRAENPDRIFGKVRREN